MDPFTGPVYSVEVKIDEPFPADTEPTFQLRVRCDIAENIITEATYKGEVDGNGDPVLDADGV